MKALSRRKLMQLAGISAGVLAAGSVAGDEQSAKRSSSALKLKFGGYDFPRLAGLTDGRVAIEGCQLEFVPGKIGDMNIDLFSGQQVRDVTEVGLHPFILAYANDEFRDYSLLPVFPLRQFRQKSAFIRTDRGIDKPEDLKGKRVSTAGYSSTSLTWLRGVLQDEYNLKPEDMTWVIAQGDSSAQIVGGISKQESVTPDGVPARLGPPGLDESDLLEKGLVDACFHAAEPRAYAQGKPNIGRLFPNARPIEQDYYRRTGIFPIMHTVAIRNKLLKEEPWIARAVFNGYSQAKQLDYEFMTKMGWAYSSLPWFAQELEDTQALMGKNFYSYGLEANRSTLDTLLRYSYEQGLARRRVTVEELFAPESLELSEG